MSDWLTQLNQWKKEGESFAVLTISEVVGSTPRDIGAKMLVTPNTFWGTIGGGQLEKLAIEDARRALSTRLTQKIRYPLGAKAGQCCGGLVEVFIEVFTSSPSLYLFGAGHVGQAVSQTLQGTTFQVHLIDERAEWIYHTAIPEGANRHACEWEDFVEEASWDESLTYVGIMTHEHARDEAILRYVLKKPTRYIGLIGSEAKWKRFQSRLLERGFSPSEISKVKCPIGVGRTGKAPKEVAISFSAELLQKYYV